MFVVKIVQDEALYPFQSEAILQYAAAIERVEQFVSIFTFFTANEGLAKPEQSAGFWS